MDMLIVLAIVCGCVAGLVLWKWSEGYIKRPFDQKYPREVEEEYHAWREKVEKDRWTQLQEIKEGNTKLTYCEFMVMWDECKKKILAAITVTKPTRTNPISISWAAMSFIIQLMTCIT